MSQEQNTERINGPQIGGQEQSFAYTYSAERQDEIERIRSKYLPREEDKMDLLRKMDRDVTKPGTIWGIVIGVIGSLLLGIGMSCTMVWAGAFFVPGIIIGVVGMIIMGAAYPVYIKITKKERERIAPQILALTEELSETH